MVAGAWSPRKLVPELDIAEAQGLLPQFSFDRPLVPGAQGDVSLARNASGDRVVVKIVSGQWIDRGDREIRALELLSHPSLIRLLDSGRVDYLGAKLPYMVTEFIEGSDLQNLLTREAFDVAAAPRLISSIADGLDALWRERVVHRDIKPPNIMVRPDGRGVLLDLGIARCLDMTSLTGSWGAPGTVGYLSPEQARGDRNLTVKSDVYSLGIAAYEAIVGAHPFGRNQSQMASAGASPIVPSGAPCSRTTGNLISAMLAPLPAMRPMPAVVMSTLASEV